MSLLVPDTGLLFWMALSFGIVLVVLARYGFPVVLRAIDARRTRIEQALQAAKDAEARLADIDVQAAAILDKANAERGAMLKEAQATREALIGQARSEAQAQTALHLEKARAEADELRRKALSDAASQIAALSVKVAEKVVGDNLRTDAEQTSYIERLLKEEQPRG